MKKLFNKKMMIVYIVLLCLTLIGGCVCGGFGISYNAKYNKIIEENKTSGVEGVLTDLLSSVVESLADQATNGSASSNNDTEDDLPEGAKEMQDKKTVCLIIMGVLFGFTVVFSGMAIGSHKYVKYLDSDKYKAKLKRLKKYEKIKASQK